MPLKKFLPRRPLDDNPDRLGIRLHLHSQDGRIPSWFLNESVYAVEEELFAVELEELSELLETIGPVPAGLRQECFSAIERYRGAALAIDHASDGSIILGAAAVGGVAFWVIEHTVGESFKEAWKRSDMHAKLQELFLARLPWRRKKVQEKLSARLEKPGAKEEFAGSVNHQRNGSDLVTVDLVLHNAERVAPSPLDWLVRSKKNKERDSVEDKAQQKKAA